MLSATLDSFPKKQYALLGKLLLQKEPETAHKLISAYLPAQQPSETDFTKIPDYYISYCRVQGIKPQDYVGPLYKSSKVNVRRTFIAVILHVYVPHVYTQPIEAINLPQSFVRSISDTLLQKQPNVSNMIREVVQWEKSYEDFSNSVTSIIEKLTAE